jgi:hypothetical protein
MTVAAAGSAPAKPATVSNVERQSQSSDWIIAQSEDETQVVHHQTKVIHSSVPHSSVFD